jgi:hypothetical protein
MNYSPVRDYASDQCSFGDDLGLRVRADSHGRPYGSIKIDEGPRVPGKRASEILHGEVLNQEACWAT